MASSFESNSVQNAPETPEQIREREQMCAEHERRLYERDLATTDALIDKNPSKEMVERILRRIIEKIPEEQPNLERISAEADIQVLEFLTKVVPPNPEVSGILDERKKRHSKLKASLSGAEQQVTVAEKPPVAHKPQEAVKQSEEYPSGTKILSANEVRNIEKAGKAALEGKSERIQESSPEQRLLEKKIGQANLLISTAEAYRDYLSNLESHIRFKNVSEKPERYEDQVHAIESVLGELSSIASMPESRRIEALKHLDIRTLTDRVFIPETKLSTLGSGIMNQPMFEIDTETGEKRFMPNIASTLEETEGRYIQMKSLITEGNDFSPESVQKKKYEILTLLRKNDSRDDDGLRLNSGEAISKQVEGDILKSPKLRKNESIRQTFDTLLSMNDDPKAMEAMRSVVFGSSIPSAHSFEKFFQSHGINLSKEALGMLSKKSIEYRSAEKDITEKQVEELSKRIESNEVFTAEFVREFKANPTDTVKKVYENDATRKIFSFTRREAISGALESNIGMVRELRKTDPALALYTNIEGITHTPDNTMNERINTSTFILEQLMIMYVAGLAGNALARTSFMEKPVKYFSNGAESLAKTTRMAPFAGKGMEIIGTTVTEGVPFALVYSSLNGLANQGYLHKETVDAIGESMKNGNSLSENARIIEFLAVIKLMLPIVSKIPNPQAVIEKMFAKEFPEFALGIAKNQIASKGLEISRTGIQIGQNVTLDTAALIGADTVIRGIRKEDLPKNADEIPNYLMQEFEVIIFYVVGLRTLTNTMTSGLKPPDMAEVAQKQIDVNYQKNGDIAIRMAEGRVVVIRKELRNLDQVHDRLRNGGHSKLDSHAIATEKREKKAELKGAVADAESIRQELASHEAGIAALERNVQLSEQIYKDATAGIDISKNYTQKVLPDKNSTATGTNHTANHIKGLEIDPKSIRLSDTMSGFSPTLNAEAIGSKFSELRDGMRNIESPELLQMQAETVIQGELQVKYNAMMKEYNSLTPEAQRTMDVWRESMEGQAKELANDFQNALKTKLEGGKIDGKFGNPEYLDRMMGTFAEKANPQLKEEMKGTKDVKKDSDKKKEEIPTL